MQSRVPWFFNLQLQSLFQSSSIQNTLKKEKTAFELILEIQAINKGLISQIYSILHDTEDIKDPPVINKWNGDCNSNITRAQWDFINTSFMVSTNLLTIKMSLKLLYRWYLTPSRVSHFCISTSNLCWKVCGATADDIHCWWKHNKLNAFWLGRCWRN